MDKESNQFIQHIISVGKTYYHDNELTRLKELLNTLENGMIIEITLILVHSGIGEAKDKCKWVYFPQNKKYINYNAFAYFRSIDDISKKK